MRLPLQDAFSLHLDGNAAWFQGNCNRLNLLRDVVAWLGQIRTCSKVYSEKLPPLKNGQIAPRIAAISDTVTVCVPAASNLIMAYTV
jgi:hypothetical protein